MTLKNCMSYCLLTLYMIINSSVSGYQHTQIHKYKYTNIQMQYVIGNTTNHFKFKIQIDSTAVNKLGAECQFLCYQIYI